MKLIDKDISRAGVGNRYLLHRVRNNLWNSIGNEVNDELAKRVDNILIWEGVVNSGRHSPRSHVMNRIWELDIYQFNKNDDTN
jgi:hypothetical protein